jgi:Mn-containing catalase
MFKYDKKLPYPINIKKKDLKMAKYIVTQFGGANGELGDYRYYDMDDVIKNALDLELE